METYEEDIVEDEGLTEVFDAHPELRVTHITVEPLSLVERAVVGFNRHREAWTAVGGTMLAGTGLAVGALAFSGRRH